MNMVLDEAVRQELADAELDAIVDDFKRQGVEIQSDISDGIRAQLAEFGFDDPERTTKSDVTTTAAPLTIWNRETGEPSHTTSDAIGQKVRIRFPKDHPTMPGQRVWSTMPMEPKIVGSYKCPLHPDSPDRALMTSLGLGAIPCNAGALRTSLDVDLHLKAKHRRSYDVLMQHRETERHREQMDMMRMQTEAFERMAAGQNPAPGRQMSDEQRQAAADRLAKGRETAAANRAARASA